MKKIKKIFVFAILLVGALPAFNSQSNDFEEELQAAQLLEKEKTSKFIYYKGLKVKHRFKTTEEELKIEHNEYSLQMLYNNMRIKKKAKGIKSTSNIKHVEVELPNAATIVAAAKVILSSFPYEEIEGYVAVSRPDGNVLDERMIKSDFPDLSEAEIKANGSIIDQYYSDNLDYMVLDIIAENPATYERIGTQQQWPTNSRTERWTYICTMDIATSSGYGFVRGTISYLLAGDRAKDSSKNYYPSLPEADSRRDAYRHMLWNALLAQYYFTISSKAPRIGFAKLVANARESWLCGTINAIDSRAMDYHNNVIGRNIWDDNTSYRTTWFGWTYGLNLTTTSHLKGLTRKRVEENGLYIVTDYLYGSNYEPEEAKAIILQTNINTPVYLVGEIAPVRYISRTVRELYDCDEPDRPEPDRPQPDPYDPVEGEDCYRYITTYTTIYPHFISKDANFNPF